MHSFPGLISLRSRLTIAGAVVLLTVIVLIVVFSQRTSDAPSPVRDAVKRVVGDEEKTQQQHRERQEEARRALDTLIETHREEVNRAERQRLKEIEKREEEEHEQAAEEARREREREAEERRIAEKRREEERRLIAERKLEREAELLAQREAEERARSESEETRRREEEERLAAESVAPSGQDREDWNEDGDGDDTLDVETETTVDEMVGRGAWRISGDVRPIVDALYEESRDGTTEFDGAPGVRARIGANFGITKRLRVGTRVAGSGFLGDFNPNFILPGTEVDSSELDTGTATFDQLFLLWQRRERFSLAVGRLQTRFLLRGGVFAKSLDRNNSHNWRVNYTNGLQATIKALGWNSSFVLEVNPRTGPTGVRRDPLDFDDDGARFSYFLGFDNSQRRGVTVQRAFDISYLPASLLKDGRPDGRRTDYWGFVGRLTFVWPPEKEGLRLRAGAEIGYAPKTPTYEAVNLPGAGDVSGLAWNVVISAMDVAPGHNIGLNYARTGAGWLISPQYRPNHELIEFRWQWLDWKIPMLETRIRRRTELDQQVDTVRRRFQWDFFVRATYRFTLRDK